MRHLIRYNVNFILLEYLMGDLVIEISHKKGVDLNSRIDYHLTNTDKTNNQVS